jgi:hypothetical protein
MEHVTEDGKVVLPGVSEPVGPMNRKFVDKVRWLRQHPFRMSAALKATNLENLCMDSAVARDEWRMVFHLLRQAGFYSEKSRLSRDNFRGVRDVALEACGRRNSRWAPVLVMRRRPDVM